MRRIALASFALLSAITHGQSPSPHKVLVWVSTRATVVTNTNGIRQDRFFINDPEMDRIREALDLFEKSAEAESGGNLDVQIDLKIDSVPFYRFPGQKVDHLVNSIESRFNESPFESDDKTYRGPYAGVIVVDPQPGAWADGSELRKTTPVLSMRFGTAVGYLSLLPTNGGAGAGALAEDFLAMWRGQLSLRAGLPKGDEWRSVPPAGAIVRPAQAVGNPVGAFKPLDPIGPGLFGEIAKTETENGPAFKVRVNSGPREGQLVILDGLDVNLASTPILEFWLRITALDPLELRVGEQRVSIGYLPGATKWVEPKRDGTWQKFTIGLASAGSAPSVILGVPEASRLLENIQYGYREFEIAGIRFLAGAGTADSMPPPADELLRASMSSAPLLEVEAALDHPATSVKVAALYRLAYGAEPPSAERFKRLSELSRNPEPLIALFAIRAMARIQTPEVAEALKYNLETGPFEHCRLGAAITLGEVGSEQNTPLLATLLTAREWRSRVAGVTGLAKFVTRENSIILLAMLPDPEAEVRRTICSMIDLKMDLANRRLLFVAVNDPVESVRIAAYRNLLTNGLTEFKAEAMKGVREESPYVRSEVLKIMAAKPDAAFRRYVLIGLSDRDPRVRLAALDALGKQPGQTVREEIANVLVDGDAEVRRAAEAFAQARGIQ
ncbi:MAG: HEAT repeat domain-containing protein [Chthonomonas sp.]|nr:HEAT repeat domain-containing protein [Chthonomonas sp.]